MRAQAVIRLCFSSEKSSQILFRALKPETRTPPNSRSKVQIKRENNKIILIVEAKDTSALRAFINSYLRLIYLSKNIMHAVDMLPNAIEKS